MKHRLVLWRRFGPILLLWVAAPLPLYIWAGISLTLGLK